MSEFQTLNVKLNDQGILQITLNRPDKLNALNAELLAELLDVLERAATDDSIKALLLTGEGKAFAAGADIDELAGLNALEGLQFAQRGQAIFRFLETLGKPSLAAVNGFALGGGCELAMATTMRIASVKAKFGQPEVKLGVIPGYGGTQRLARLVGKGRAMDLCLTGRMIGAEDALAWGLVSSVSEMDDLINDAYDILNTILGMAPEAVSATMDVIDRGFDLNMSDALELEASRFGVLCGTQDMKEGTAAFLEKRKAEFTGK